MQMQLWGDEQAGTELLGDGAALLRGLALPEDLALWNAVLAITGEAPFRQLTTPGGHPMSVATTSCGRFGWVSDAAGYRYQQTDPVTKRPWPGMPPVFRELAHRAASAASYTGFEPDACLINRYEAGAKMGLHQDRNEQDMSQPIVSVSLGLPATFLFGGLNRGDPVRRIQLRHGDVAVWGGPSRLCFHGVSPLKGGDHPLTGCYRVNLTFRRVQAPGW